MKRNRDDIRVQQQTNPMRANGPRNQIQSPTNETNEIQSSGDDTEGKRTKTRGLQNNRGDNSTFFFQVTERKRQLNCSRKKSGKDEDVMMSEAKYFQNCIFN